jgi:hypothetical protein
MRRHGKPYTEIATARGYASPNAASKDVHRALVNVVVEEGQALLALERERTEELWATAWPLAAAGDTRAIRECTRILERRARMLGVDRAAAAVTDTAELEAMKQSLGNAFLAAAANLPDTTE